MLVPQQLLLKTLIFCCLIGPVSQSLQLPVLAFFAKAAT